MSASLHMVSIGPGFADYVTPAAENCIKNADVIVAYDLYLTWIQPWLQGKEIITLPLTEEKARALAAIEAARAGKRAAIISSGDIGVYGMASLVFEELSESDQFEVGVIPGVTAATSCASLLGAPLAHDFMTLSLSDLLCPWDWIENRAEHAAKADLCMAFYNVMSKKRTDGIYKIIKLISRHKSPGTVCGIVRNAYRPDQSVSIVPLSELHLQKFDMLTTVIIGNKFTRRKGKWMFTPRGYNQWSVQNSLTSYPANAVWIFSGTSDGNEIARALSATGVPIVISAATEYGAQLAGTACPTAHVVFGRVGRAARQEILKQSHCKAIVDATHPYAEQMSKQLIEIGKALNLPYIRFERPASEVADTASATCSNLLEALEAASAFGQRIFLSTGSKELDTIKGHELLRQNRVFVRITPDLQSMEKALSAGIAPANIVAMQGPFDKDVNIAMWRQFNIDVVVTKESGNTGGFDGKAAAAKEMRLPLIIIKRPNIAYPLIARDAEEILQLVQREAIFV